MNQYRIIQEVQLNGLTWYYPQRRCWLFFWEDIPYRWRKGYATLNEAEQVIKNDIAKEILKSLRKL